jgi:putative membrane protein
LDRLAPVPLFVYALIHWGLNVLALLAADWLFDGFSIERWWPVLLAGAVLGLANVFLKPLVTFIALPLILLTFGIAYFFVNVVMLLFTEWVTPDFSIDGFWTYVGATIVIWLVNWVVWTLVDAMSGEDGVRR